MESVLSFLSFYRLLIKNDLLIINFVSIIIAYCVMKKNIYEKYFLYVDNLKTEVVF